MMGGWGMMAGMGWPGILAMVLFWLGVILLVLWGVSGLFPAQRLPGPDALEILKQRYARGEISREEFEQAQQVLRA